MSAGCLCWLFQPLHDISTPLALFDASSRSRPTATRQRARERVANNVQLLRTEQKYLSQDCPVVGYNRGGTRLAVQGRHIRVLRCIVAAIVFQHSRPKLPAIPSLSPPRRCSSIIRFIPSEFISMFYLPRSLPLTDLVQLFS